MQKVSYYRNETLNPGTGLGVEGEDSKDSEESKLSLGRTEDIKDCDDKNATVKTDDDATLGAATDAPVIGVDVAALKRPLPRHHSLLGVDIPSFNHFRRAGSAHARLGSASGTTSSPISITLLAPIGALVGVALAGIVARRRRGATHSETSALLAERFSIDENASLV